MEPDQKALRVLQKVFEAQRKRAELYSSFHQSFQAMCETKQERPYLQMLQQLTGDFNEVSKSVIALEREAQEECNRPDIAEIIRSIQAHERSKLRDTVTLQALRKAHAFETFSWQANDHADVAAVIEAAAPLRDVGNQSVGQHHQVEHACGCCAPQPEQAPEATEPEWRQACAAATQELQEVVEDINEAVYELRYIQADLGGTDS